MPVRHPPGCLEKTMKKVDASADIGAAAADVLPVLVDATENLIVILDPRGRVIEFNRACRDATGFQADEVLGRVVWDVLVHDTEVAEVKERLRQSSSSTQPIGYTGHWVAKDGSRRRIEWTNAVVRGEGGEPRFIVATGVDLTDHMSVDEEGRRSPGYLKSLIMALNEDILVIDRDFTIIDVNDRALTTTGRTRDEVVGHHCYEISHGYNRPCPESGEDCALTEVFSTGRPERCQHVHTARDGSQRHVDIAMAPLFDADGVVTCVVESARDMTEAIGMASRLEVSEGRFKALVESMTDGFAIDDPDGNLTFVNPTLCKMLGYAHEDLLGHPLADYIDPASRETLWEHSVQRSIDPDADTESYELKVQRSDGSMIELLVSPQRILNGDLQYAGSFAVLTDVSRLKRMERTHLLLGTAIEQAAESVVITDGDGTIQYVNPAFERTTGYSSDEVIGGNPRVLKSGEHDDAFYRDLWQTITGGRVWSGQFTNLRRDGVLYQEEATISPVRGESGTIEAFVAVKRDVSVERDLAEQLNRAQKLEALGELAGGIAHDLNNLLLTITGAAELLRLRLPSTDDVGGEFETIRETVVRGADLTRHLLSVAQQQVIEMVAIDLDEVIRSELEVCRSLFPDSVAVDFSPGDTPSVVLGDRGLLSQVLVSLCANARDAMPGGGTLTITTDSITADALLLTAHSAAEEGRYARLRVEDDGAGMESEVRDRAFDPFFSTKKVSQSSGMGLDTVYGIVRQHHGMIELESSPGVGTRIDIYLPLTSEPMAAAVEDPHPDPVDGHETILVVEDEGRVRRTQVKMLEALGYTVVEATNGKVALEVLDAAENPVDLILSDVSMPEMGGQELYDRARDLHPELAFVFTSGYTGSSFLKRFQHGETVHFLPKPHSMADLAGIIRRALLGLE